MIEIFEPRYHDKVVLVASYKIPRSGDLEIKITKGYYAGAYVVSVSELNGCKKDVMKTKRGGNLEMVAIPLDMLRKVN